MNDRINDLAPAMDDQFIPAKIGQGHWLFHFIKGNKTVKKTSIRIKLPLSINKLETMITPDLYRDFVDTLSREELEMDFEELIKFKYCP